MEHINTKQTHLELIKRYIELNYSPIRSFIGVPEIIKIKEEFDHAGLSKEVIDLGGGDGLAASLIGNYFDINIDNATHQDFKENPVYNETIVGDITNLPQETDQVRVTTCISVIEHIPNWPDVLSEAYRVLQPGGTFVLTSPNKSFFMPGISKWPIFKSYFKVINKNHFKLFTLDELEETLRQTGFKDIEITSIGGRILGYYWMVLRPLEFILPKKILQRLFSWIARISYKQFLYEGNKGTTLYVKATK